MKRIIAICFLTTVVFGALRAQIAWLNPPDPSPTDTVTLYYNAAEGNKALAGHDGTVYLHTGVITQKSIDGGDWKHVVGNWGEDDPRVKMTALGNDLYKFTFVINDFYGLDPDEIPQQLAFVFRSVNGAKVGKTETNEDIFINVNGYRPPEKTAPVYRFEQRKYVSHKRRGDTLLVHTDHGLTEIIPYTNRIVEVKHFDKDFEVPDSSVAVILTPQHVRYSVEDSRDFLTLTTDSLKLILFKDPFHLAFICDGDTVLQEERGLFSRNDNDGLRFRIQNNEKIYGLGERANGLNLVGAGYNLYNRPKYGYEIGAKNLNYSVPLVVSSKKYLLFFDNPQKGYADVGETDPGVLEWGAIGGLMKYIVIVGHDYKSIAKDYAGLTGFQPLPPRWVLGNLQSRMAYRTQYETDSVVTLMQEKDFPLDAVILDFYWFGDSIKGTMGRLKWYAPNWPDPKGMIEKFKKEGVKTVLITEPYILDSLDNFKEAAAKGVLAKDSLGNPYINYEFYFGNGGLIDMFNPAACDWFWEKYKKQIDIGVAGWWGDLGEPESHPSDIYHVNGKADEVHNIFGHYWHKCLFNKYRQDYPDRRLFNLNRAGYAGSQRYSIFPWTGDVSRSWGGLQAQLPLMLHMSLSGLPFIHSDAGGFAQGTKDNELYTRWLQMACFSPVLRPHGSGIPSEPVYFNDTTQKIVRDFMDLRYSLLPYIYTLAYQAATDGEPIVRPLFYEFPDDSITYDVGDEYMFGADMLVAPVVVQGQKMRKVYLPEGAGWYDFWDNRKYEGGQWIALKTNPETIPVFVRAGSFIPMVTPIKTTDLYTTEHLIIKYYSGDKTDNSSGYMYHDDGHTFLERNSETGYETLKFSVEKEQGTNAFIFESRNSDLPLSFKSREVDLMIIGMDFSLKQKKKLTKKKAYHYNEATGVLTVPFTWKVNGNEKIIIK